MVISVTSSIALGAALCEHITHSALTRREMQKWRATRRDHMSATDVAFALPTGVSALFPETMTLIPILQCRRVCACLTGAYGGNVWTADFPENVETSVTPIRDRDLPINLVQTSVILAHAVSIVHAGAEVSVRLLTPGIHDGLHNKINKVKRTLRPGEATEPVSTVSNTVQSGALNAD